MDPFERATRERLTELDDIDFDAFAPSFVLFRLATQYLSYLESTVHRPQGLSTAGFRVLFTVWVFGESEPRQIARMSGVSTAAVSGVVGTLESNGLVVKERDTADRRLVRIRLTETGREKLISTYRAQNGEEQRLFGDLEELPELTAQLRRLLDRLG